MRGQQQRIATRCGGLSLIESVDHQPQRALVIASCLSKRLRESARRASVVIRQLIELNAVAQREFSCQVIQTLLRLDSPNPRIREEGGGALGFRETRGQRCL